jgi:hypothetical protein
VPAGRKCSEVVLVNGEMEAKCLCRRLLACGLTNRAPLRRWKATVPLPFGEFFWGWAIACLQTLLTFILVYQLPQSQRCPGLNNFTPVNSGSLQRPVCRPCRFSHFTPVNSGCWKGQFPPFGSAPALPSVLMCTSDKGQGCSGMLLGSRPEPRGGTNLSLFSC